MINGQLELSLANARESRPEGRRQRRMSRAMWWFERMREVVDQAIDWSPAPPPPPEQILLPDVSRREQQICE
ncbi:MAG: hypothetical protein ACLQVX_13045 [Limisphaerales bacterium]